jgi:mono/diheme cytochrome c family protein
MMLGSESIQRNILQEKPEILIERRVRNPQLLKAGFSFCLILCSCVSGAFAQDTPDYFRLNCMNCHTIGGGRLTGPDLKDVGQRRDAEWLISFLQNPKAVIDSGDPYATKLVEDARGVVMPPAPGMDRYRAEQILKLIEAESKLEKSQFIGLQVSNKPFTEQDRENGYRIFTGTTRLKNGGTACIACHSMHDLSALGGGRLGPDLTRVMERLKGRKSLSAWLVAPATETMQPIFKGHPLDPAEIHSLAAYFEASAAETESDASVSRIAFLLIGLAMATGVIFGFDMLWQNRFDAVRKPLVDISAKKVLSVKARQIQVGAQSTISNAAEPHRTERGSK